MCEEEVQYAADMFALVQMLHLEPRKELGGSGVEVVACSC